VTIKMTVFWCVTPCSLVPTFRRNLSTKLGIITHDNTVSWV
jgi:hypothetical protein